MVLWGPITMLQYYCHEQFDIVWLDGDDESFWAGHGSAPNGKNLYRRLFIKRKNVD